MGHHFSIVCFGILHNASIAIASAAPLTWLPCFLALAGIPRFDLHGSYFWEAFLPS